MNGQPASEGVGGSVGADAVQRAEDIVLSAESLERHLHHQGVSDELAMRVSDVVIAARELHNEMSGVSDV